ncbi:MAG: UbiD family decarboxylase [Alphaproteobacteria bacterium]|nr:UbiD family decarboxylase [Alphaproteobacteria bacterium]
MTSDRSYRDLHDHLAALDKAGLLVTIDEPVDKDSEMHPLVRWQFCGGLAEKDRKAFLFNNITDGKGRTFSMPVVVGALAANQDVYSTGMEVPVGEIGGKWQRAIANPVAPNIVDKAPCHEVVLTGDDLLGEGNGLDGLPIPVSTPGFDAAPTLTSTNTITRDPETGVQNMGTYRCGLKAPDRLVVRMATRVGGAGGYLHWQKYQAKGEKMPCAIVLGCPPYVAFMGPQKLPIGMDEVEVAGGLAGAPINMVQARTVDLLVPAESEIVIEGLVDTKNLEPEGPFGESHGHVALEEFNMPMQITAITHKKKPIIPSYISQVAPSESSVMKRVAYEPLFLAHLRDTLGIKGVMKVALHEPLTGLLRVTVVTVDKDTPKTEIWRALYGAASFKGDCGKICIAVNEDIDPDNADALLWAMAYRHNPIEDVQILEHRGQGHGPKREHGGEEDSTLLIDATMKSDMPPLALPKKEYMEKAKALWERLDLPPLRPMSPWFGYSLGDWTKTWDDDAARAASGDYLENGRRTLQRQQSGLVPETSVRDVETDW